MKYLVSVIVEAAAALKILEEYGPGSVEAYEPDAEDQPAPAPRPIRGKPKQTRNRVSKLGELLVRLTADEPKLPSETFGEVVASGFKRSSVAGTLASLVNQGRMMKDEDGRYSSNLMTLTEQ